MKREVWEREPRTSCHITATIAALTAIGTTVTGGAITGTSAAVAGGLATAGSLATTGLSIAQAAGAFDPKVPRAPTPEDSASLINAQTDRRRGFVKRQKQTGDQVGPQRSNIATPSILGHRA